jgi:hypothetical protein
MKYTRKSLVLKAFASILALAVGSANAAFQCNAQTLSVLVYSDGTVNILHSGRGDYTNVCNLNIVYKGVPTATCAMWTAMLLQAKRNNTLLQFYYDGTGACSTLPTYSSAPAPIYIGPTN